MMASARARVLTEVTSNWWRARSKPDNLEEDPDDCARASTASTMAATLPRASRVTSRYSAMPWPGLGAEESADGETQPPASHPSANDNTNGEATAFRVRLNEFIAT